MAGSAARIFPATETAGAVGHSRSLPRLWANIALGSAVFAVRVLAYAVNSLHAFYIDGSSFYDAGWSAYLIHDADLRVHNPLAADSSMSWFNWHVSPLFLLTSALGHFLPLTRAQFYAAFVGVSHALPAIAVFWLLVSGYRMTSPGQRAVARCWRSFSRSTAWPWRSRAIPIS